MCKQSIGYFVATFAAFWPDIALSQAIQLPTVRTFGVSTTVTVPDHGSALLGRNSRALATPYGLSRSVLQASVTASIIDLQQMDAAVLAEARLRRAASSRDLPEDRGSVESRRAAHPSKYVGRAQTLRTQTLRAQTPRAGANRTHLSRSDSQSQTYEPSIAVTLTKPTYDELMRLGRDAMSTGRYRDAKQYFMEAAADR